MCPCRTCLQHSTYLTKQKVAIPDELAIPQRKSGVQRRGTAAGEYGEGICCLSAAVHVRAAVGSHAVLQAKPSQNKEAKQLTPTYIHCYTNYCNSAYCAATKCISVHTAACFAPPPLMAQYLEVGTVGATEPPRRPEFRCLRQLRVVAVMLSVDDICLDSEIPVRHGELGVDSLKAALEHQSHHRVRDAEPETVCFVFYVCGTTPALTNIKKT